MSLSKVDKDSKLLAKFGYRQDLNRSMKGFSSFAIFFFLTGRVSHEAERSQRDSTFPSSRRFVFARRMTAFFLTASRPAATGDELHERTHERVCCYEEIGSVFEPAESPMHL